MKSGFLKRTRKQKVNDYKVHFNKRAEERCVSLSEQEQASIRREFLRKKTHKPIVGEKLEKFLFEIQQHQDGKREFWICRKGKELFGIVRQVSVNEIVTLLPKEACYRKVLNSMNENEIWKSYVYSVKAHNSEKGYTQTFFRTFAELDARNFSVCHPYTYFSVYSASGMKLSTYLNGEKLC